MGDGRVDVDSDKPSMGIRHWLRCFCRRFCAPPSAQLSRHFPFQVSVPTPLPYLVTPTGGSLFVRQVTRRSLSRPSPHSVIFSVTRTMTSLKVSSRAHDWRGIRAPPNAAIESPNTPHTHPTSHISLHVSLLWLKLQVDLSLGLPPGSVLPDDLARPHARCPASPHGVLAPP